MPEIRCDICGGKLTMQQGGKTAICNDCKMEYSRERIVEMIQQDGASRKLESADSFMDIRDGVLVKYSGRAKSLILPKSITKIGEYAFAGGSSKPIDQYRDVDLQEITIPDSIEEIGEYAFYNCASLRQVNLSEGLQKISPCAFCGCEQIEKLNLPKSLKHIGWGAFSHCSKLTSIEVQSAQIDSGAFSYCLSLKKAILPKSLLQKPQRIFCDSDDEGYDVGCCNSLDAIYIGSELIEPIIGNRDLILGCLYGTMVHSKLLDVLEVYLVEHRCPYCGGNVKKHFFSQRYICEQCQKDFGGRLTSIHYAGVIGHLGKGHYNEIISSDWYIRLKQKGKV